MQLHFGYLNREPCPAVGYESSRKSRPNQHPKYCLNRDTKIHTQDVTNSYFLVQWPKSVICDGSLRTTSEILRARAPLIFLSQLPFTFNTKRASQRDKGRRRLFVVETRNPGSSLADTRSNTLDATEMWNVASVHARTVDTLIWIM